MKKIKLTQGKNALVDDLDFEFVKDFKWYARFDGFNWYASRNVRSPLGKRKTQSMHNLILGRRVGFEIDHKNGNGLDNQRKNLRFLTHSKNLLNRGRQSNNTSGVIGVSFHKATNKYRAYGRLNGKHIHLGIYDKIKEAETAYKKFAVEHYKI